VSQLTFLVLSTQIPAGEVGGGSDFTSSNSNGSWDISNLVASGLLNGAANKSKQQDAQQQLLGAVLPARTHATCVDPFNFPEVQWTPQEAVSTHAVWPADIRLEGEMTYGAVRLLDDESGISIATRGFDGLIPGPIIRMRACQKYRLTLENHLNGYPNPQKEWLNKFTSPMTTNLYARGLHMSGVEYATFDSADLPGSEKQFIEVLPEELFEFAWDIPCDHAGGTFLYHPQYHGSSGLQTTTGSAGVIIIEDSDLTEAINRPEEYDNMPEAVVVLMEMDPSRSKDVAEAADDIIYRSNVQKTFVLANGCTSLEVPIEQNQWTRIRMSFVGFDESFFADIRSLQGAGACDMQLLAKDGVYLRDVPRSLPSGRLFFAPGSTADIAIRCSEAGSRAIDMVSASGSKAKAYERVATLTVRESSRQAGPEKLSPWVPCRPTYLMDRLKAQTPAGIFSLDFTDKNFEAWPSEVNFLHKMESAKYSVAADSLYEWNISGSGVLPVHFHVNPLQIVDIGQEWEGMPPEWNAVGDWVNTISSPGTVTARMYADRWGGPMLVQAPPEHADQGLIFFVNVEGGLRPEDEQLIDVSGVYYVPVPDIWKPFPTNCERTPYYGPGRPHAIPGVTEAELFDRGGPGKAYMDTTSWIEGIPSQFRSSEGVDIQADKEGWNGRGDNFYLTEMQAGEWVTYTTEVLLSGSYTMEVRAASFETSRFGPASIRFRMDSTSCVTSDGKLLAHVEVPNTGSWTDYAPFTFEDIKLEKGVHNLLLCVSSGAKVSIDSFSFLPSGRSAGLVVGKFGTAREWEWTGRPDTVMYRPPAPEVATVNVVSKRALDATTIGYRGLRGLGDSRTSAFSDRLSTIKSEMAMIPTLASSVTLVAEYGEPEILTTMMDEAVSLGLHVQLIVPIGPYDRDNMRVLNAAAALFAVPAYSKALDIVVVGDFALQEQTVNHVRKLTQHAMALLHSAQAAQVPVSIGESLPAYDEYLLQGLVDVVYACTDPIHWGSMADLSLGLANATASAAVTHSSTLEPIPDNLVPSTASAVSFMYADYVQKVKRPLYLGLTGWPSEEESVVDADGVSITSEVVQEEFMRSMLTAFATHQAYSGEHVPWGLREAFDRSDSSYGMYSSTGEPKQVMHVYGMDWTQTPMVFFGSIAIVGLLLLCTGFGFTARCFKPFTSAEDESTAPLEIGGKEYLKGVTSAKLSGRMAVRRSRAAFTNYTSVLAVVICLTLGVMICLSTYQKTNSIGSLVVIILVQLLISIPFMLYPVIAGVQNITYMLLPGANRVLYQNSEYYSAIPEPKAPEASMLSVTIILPVYKEDLRGVIAPTMTSLMKAIKHFEALGGSANILVAEDGLQVVADSERAAREQFYSSMPGYIGWAARPPNNIRHRAGAFKKASNVNYLHGFVDEVDRVVGVNPSVTREQAAKLVAESQDHTCLYGGRHFLGDLVLLVDSDTRVPLDCLSAVQGEFIHHSNLGFVQCRTTPLLMANTSNQVVDMIAYITADIWDHAIAYGCATGIVCPLIGHNAFLRTAALKAASNLLPEDRGLIWSEHHVSEDFEMMLRMNSCNYFGRYVSYTGPEFKEGIPLHAEDDIGRQARFAYGAIEIMFNNPRFWVSSGVFSPILKNFLRADIPWTSKLSTFAYLMNFFAKAAAIVAMTLFFIVLMIPQLHSLVILFADPLEVQIFTTFIFGVTGFFASIIYRITNSARHGVLRTCFHVLEYLWYGTFLGALYHMCTLFDATTIMGQFLLKKPESVSFGATSKSQDTGSFLRHLSTVMYERRFQNTCLLFVSFFSLGVVAIFRPQSLSGLDDGTANIDGLTASFNPFTWFVMWWIFAASHVLNPCIFVVLEHLSMRPLEGTPEQQYTGVELADDVAPEYEAQQTERLPKAVIIGSSAATPPMSPLARPV
jgi:FtsP/CotA-like multicopper oxidase with cupredoxin domain/cellulose synthase/poly-beta-1,6-N-acetylglucosamine synthase-like glycosyltransferase